MLADGDTPLLLVVPAQGVLRLEIAVEVVRRISRVAVRGVPVCREPQQDRLAWAAGEDYRCMPCLHRPQETAHHGHAIGTVYEQVQRVDQDHWTLAGRLAAAHCSGDVLDRHGSAPRCGLLVERLNQVRGLQQNRHYAVLTLQSPVDAPQEGRLSAPRLAA